VTMTNLQAESASEWVGLVWPLKENRQADCECSRQPYQISLTHIFNHFLSILRHSRSTRVLASGPSDNGFVTLLNPAPFVILPF
jgi:hypothetical protein